MLAELLILFAPLLLTDARVTFPQSEILQAPDLAVLNKKSFTCINDCKVYVDRKYEKLMVTRDGNMIANFNTIVGSNAFVPAGVELAAGTYYVENRGEVDPTFVFYVVDSTAPNYRTPVYAPQDTLGISDQNKKRYSTILSSFPAIWFFGFNGTFPAGYPRIYATGFDAAGDTACSPVYKARSQWGAEMSWPTIISSVLTIDYGYEGEHSVSFAQVDGKNPTKTGSTSIVYTSPGHIGCAYNAYMSYYSPLKTVADDFTLETSSLDITGAYSSIALSEAVQFSVNDDKLDFNGTSTLTKHYGDGKYHVVLSYTRMTEDSTFALQLDFGAVSDPVYSSTAHPVSPTTSSSRWLSMTGSLLLMVLAMIVMF